MRAWQWTSLLLIGFLVAVGPARPAGQQTLEIASKTGVHAFIVEIADTEPEREKGLMFRKELPEGRGMLFDFHAEQEVSFWMQNTYIPLDMIFIRGDGRVLRIAENTEPLSTRIIPSGGRCGPCWRSSPGPPGSLALPRATGWLHRFSTPTEACFLG